MLDRGSESLLRRIWDDDDDEDNCSPHKHTPNRQYISRQAPPPPLRDNLGQAANINQTSASDSLIRSAFPDLHSLELEIERMRNMKALHEPTASRTTLETNLALLQLNRIDAQNTRASDLNAFRRQTSASTRDRVRSQNDVPGVNAAPVHPSTSSGFSIWSAYGSANDTQRSPYDAVPLQTNTNSYTRVNDSQMPSHRPRAGSETVPPNTIYQYPVPQTSTSCPTYPQQLQQPARITNIDTHNTFTPSTASYLLHTIEHQHQQPARAPNGFQPMHAVLTANNPNAFKPPVGPNYYHQHSQPMHPQLASRFSSRYHGMHTESNASADHLQPDENAGLWLTNLPPDVTHNELLSSIRNIGRIWCSYINQPDFQQHVTAAAKVVFFQPRAAMRLLHFAAAQGLNIRGFRVKVTQNRIKTPAQPLLGSMSRVLIITGKSTFVNPETLVDYFTERFVFQLDQARELLSWRGRTVVEFRFGSFRCQSQMGKMSLEKDRPEGFEKVEFGEDPCELGETNSSFDVAKLRIAGIGL